MQEEPIVRTPKEARQATSNKLNFRVLVMSMVLAIIVAGLIYAVFYSLPDRPTGPQSVGDTAPPATTLPQP